MLNFCKENGIDPTGAKWNEIETVSRLRKWCYRNDVISIRFARKEPHIIIDLLVAEGPMYETYKSRSQLAVSGKKELFFVSKEDLIAMKQAAGRPKDLQDIEAIEAQ